MALLKVRQFAENLKAFLDLLALKILQTFRSKALHGERSHDTTIKQRTLQHFTIDLALGRDIAHKSASKRITRSGRIFYFFNRQRRRTERVRSDAEGSVPEKNRGAIFAVFHHQRARSHREHLLRRAREILFPSQHFGLGVIDE